MSVRLVTALAATLGFAAHSAHAADFIGLTTGNQIGMISSANPGAASFTAISGLAAGERMLGIDLRPSNNMVYGVSSLNRLYTLNAATGAASFVTALNSAIINTGIAYGIDFNPVADINGAASLRFVSQAGNNYAINASTGAVGNLSGVIQSGITAVAYSNSDASKPTMAPASTTLYYINTATDSLLFAPSAFNAPTLTQVGSLGLGADVIGANGFEIDAMGRGWAALTLDNGDSGLYMINLATGAATLSGALNANLRGLTSAPFTAPVPEPESYALMLAGLGLIGTAARRRMTRS